LRIDLTFISKQDVIGIHSKEKTIERWLCHEFSGNDVFKNRLLLLIIKNPFL
jgi:hypothetical protein